MQPEIFIKIGGFYFLEILKKKEKQLSSPLHVRMKNLSDFQFNINKTINYLLQV